jgi:hypothetical protein
MGMLSKNYQPLEQYNGYVKNKKEIVLFTENDNIIKNFTNFEKINLNYVNQQQKDKIPQYKNTSSYYSTMLISHFEKPFFNLQGKDFKELRETRNKYNKIITIKYNINPNNIISFIDTWNQERGKNKYGWQLHSGYDKNFFTKYYEQEKNNLWSNFFYADNQLVGYSIVSKNTNKDYKYIVRKNNTNFRNLTLYIDYCTFEKIYSEINKDFLINWGANSGSLLKYKKKFPIFAEEKKYFYKFEKIS